MTNSVLELAMQHHLAHLEMKRRIPKSENNTLLKLIQKRRRENRDLRFLISGAVGLGKSTLALKICSLADKKFSNHPVQAVKYNVHFLAKDFIRAASTLPNKSAILLDEGILSAFSRSYMTAENAFMSKVFATMRFKKYVTIICVPVIDLLDVNLRRLVDILIVCNSQGNSTAYEVIPAKFGGPVYHNTFIDSLTWKKTPKTLWDPYQKKKFEIENKEYVGYAAKLETKHQTQKTDEELINDIHSKFGEMLNDRGNLSVLEIQNHTKTGRDRAYRLKRAYESEYPKDS